ncbi:methyl-accepting chemotaxis protein [Roseateles sp. MS654]|uniref:methyl-accepting chemotaxis protein n=1 Tax=Roseateles sp. MS654 TaxID=3412685 RepID=UPI003C2E88CB
MTALANLRIGVRLTVGFAAVIALLIVLALIGVTRISAIAADTDIILHDRFVKVKLAQTVENEVNAQLRAMRTALIVSDRALVDRELAKLDASLPVVEKAMEQLTATVRSDRGQAALRKLVDSRSQFKDKEHRLVELIKAGKTDEARSHLVSDILPMQAVYLASVEEFAESQAAGMEEFGAEAAALARSAKVLMMVLSVIAVLLAVAIGVVLTRSITHPIAKAVHVAQTVAAGDLTSSIDVRTRDETGQLLAALKSMNESLVRIVDQVRLSSESIASGSQQIATGSADLSHRTEEQASSLEETASAMEQVSATAQRSADSARSATTLAATASEVAVRGGTAVAEIVSTMREISASSSKIADITGVIDGIAFQTNILALNAAVEAARAGEQGRGFAVVAGEVRTLAQRAGTAAKEIRGLIGENVSRVEAGSRLVEGAGSTMDEIVRQIKEVAQLISEIGAATGQQSLGIGEVSKAVSVLDQVTQQNAALVEESAAAAESLSNQARRLTEVVGAFKLGAHQ